MFFPDLLEPPFPVVVGFWCLSQACPCPDGEGLWDGRAHTTETGSKPVIYIDCVSPLKEKKLGWRKGGACQ